MPWNLTLIEKWRRARQPTELLGRVEPAPKPALGDPVVAVAMESVARFNTNNELAQPEDKTAAVDALQKPHLGRLPTRSG